MGKIERAFFILLLLPVLGFGQQLPPSGLDKVHVSADSLNIQAEILPVSDAPELFNDRFYFWYSANMIHTTQGGFSGRLLNGWYKAYYPNKNLKEEGVFKEGLKDGIWKAWNESGNLIQQYTWKKGQRSGKYFLCDENGYIRESGTYRNNVLKLKDTTSFWRKLEFYRKKKMDTIHVAH
ncbi:hypothetical protein SAMN05216490_4779 [Mucilaginibacter mallensis]|uniref:MORN repeat variant n=1 Tax=Mucilaginibacter mallensis TaxID=652787 RepID=A0A1H2CAI5_MUCMA|nr:hypothetical protein [Mucilaginibacter mallensis]SDT67292.1 hypothetical protein SAMN05216490_4779 [Mucilaginibacter mallensis]